jgi:hypothetical protein
MDFTIQYFGTYDRLLDSESMTVSELIDAIDRARTKIKGSSQTSLDTADGDLELIGYVILDNRGRQVARGYRRDR